MASSNKIDSKYEVYVGVEWIKPGLSHANDRLFNGDLVSRAISLMAYFSKRLLREYSPRNGTRWHSESEGIFLASFPCLKCFDATPPLIMITS